MSLKPCRESSRTLFEIRKAESELSNDPQVPELRNLRHQDGSAEGSGSDLPMPGVLLLVSLVRVLLSKNRREEMRLRAMHRLRGISGKDLHLWG
jgi:hypothetical protein